MTSIGSNVDGYLEETKDNSIESKELCKNMRICVPFIDLTSFIAEHYGKEVIFSYVSDHEICVSTSVNALFLTKTIGINVLLLDVIDNDVKIGYKGGWGTDIIIKGIMKYLSVNMPTYNQMIDEESSGNILTVHLSRVEQLEKVFDYFRLDNIIFEKDSAVIDVSFR